MSLNISPIHINDVLNVIMSRLLIYSIKDGHGLNVVGHGIHIALNVEEPHVESMAYLIEQKEMSGCADGEPKIL